MTELVIPARTTASGAKEYPDGMPVDVLDCAVTYIQPSEFWIESTNRVCGIGVIGGDPSLLRDDVLSEVRGSMTTVGLERKIAAYEIISAGTQEAIGPLAVPNRSVVGGDFCYDLAVGSGQMGGPGAYGINSVGMLVRTWGKCLGTTYSADGTQYYVIDDGSAVTGWPASGVMLFSTATINTDDYVTATGICCLEDLDAGGIVPIIRARDSGDVQASPIPW